MASGKGCFFTSLKILCLLLIVLILVLAALFFLATGSPTAYPAPKFDGGDTGVVANIVTRLARSLVDKEGRVVETAVLRLSRDEVQTLLNAAIAKANDRGHETLPYQATWENGNLHVVFSSDPLFAGRSVNLFLEVSPVVDNGELTLIPGSGSFGHFPMPRKALDSAARKLERAAMRNDNTRTSLSAFKRIEPGEDGTLLLMFDPRDVNTVVRVLRSAGAPPEEDRDADKTDVPDEAEDGGSGADEEEEREETEE
jgi:hypothetical protein